jgi:Alpha 1,4-glycosyltransferase conserved region
LPALLAREQPGQVKVLDDHRFFWPMYWPQHLEKFFRGKESSFCSDSYCVHLWSSLSHEYLDEITPRTIWEKESEFCVLARRFLDRVLAYAGTDEIR